MKKVIFLLFFASEHKKREQGLLEISCNFLLWVTGTPCSNESRIFSYRGSCHYIRTEDICCRNSTALSSFWSLSCVMLCAVFTWWGVEERNPPAAVHVHAPAPVWAKWHDKSCRAKVFSSKNLEGFAVWI